MRFCDGEQVPKMLRRHDTVHSFTQELTNALRVDRRRRVEEHPRLALDPRLENGIIYHEDGQDCPQPYHRSRDTIRFSGESDHG
jgi:hypothetical protein